MELSQTIFRRADTNDLEGVTQLMIDLSSELPITNVCIDTIRRNIAHMYSQPNVHVFVAEKNGELLGGIGFVTGPELWSSRVLAYEAFWYVKPNYRGGIGIKLLQLAEKSIECDLIDLGVYNPKLQQLLLRQGYRVEKTIITKEL